MFLDLGLGILMLLIMVFSSGVAVDIFEKLAVELKIKKLLLATILIGFSTSLPELFVGIASATGGQPIIALGNILGANIANLSWIIGGAAILSGTLPIVGEYLKKDLLIATTAVMLPLLLMYDGVLGRIDGVALLVLYLFYVRDMIRNGSVRLKHLKLSGRKHTHHRMRTKGRWFAQGIVLTLALTVLGASAWILIDLSVKVSTSLGVSVFWAGLLVISFGTTLPELILSIMASKKREVSLILGNVLGSVTVNSTMILGIVAILHPIVSSDKLQGGISGMFLMIVLGLFWLFSKSKHRLDRWEGVVLVGVYLMFVGIQLILA